MINGLTFTGRETMLTKNIRKEQKAATEIIGGYIAPGKIFSKAERAAAEKQQQVVGAAIVRSEDAAKSYAVSHGIPAEVAADNLEKCISVFA